MNNPATLPWLPKVSLRLLIGVVTASAVSMAVIQQAVTTNAMWAVLGTAVVFAVLFPFLLYVVSFSVASLFSTIGVLTTNNLQQTIHTPTAVMPGTDFSSNESSGESANANDQESMT
ncbi:hypothetical protein [Rhodopirellula sp. MGV]|uniref:hypothetical protein n=1 Tax=Rhodopirellula sp. MGV TaxID=2023130 RepID=UPI000B96A0CE|nr:hypothetical protein [Rhodopirellula sp. MGV]OYP36050.1 hypothetical protein CGZ80_09885 [Rhodopirellula sp. MGV]PNY36591.1 hypothetical protein C2E31_12120 [Rhodopirellula baltica]